MKRILFLILLLAGWSTNASAQLQIQLTSDVTPTAFAAAEILSQHLKIPIRYDNPYNRPSIQLQCDSSLHPDGFSIISDGLTLTLYGGIDRGLTYAAYDLLERFGFRLYTPDLLISPDVKSIQLPILHITEEPDFDYREVLYYYPNHSQLYCDWHHIHNRNDLRRDWGMFVHTFKNLVPAERYFDRHPEWFSQINGRRVRDGQLCLSNPQVLEVLCQALADSMERHPEATIWSVSNNDNYNVCQCPRCRHLDSLYGGPSGTLIHFINQVARRFPDKTISTLGYQFTRQAPRQDCPYPQKPDENVNIMFCSIECGRQEAIATAPGEASFRKDMADWASLTDNIFMWDYVVQFRNFWDPFPNLHVLQPNLQFFHDHGVRMMFEQGTGEYNKTSWMELRTYLIAKLMWNTNTDADSLIHDFCKGYYGAAAPYIEKFYREMEQSLIQSGKRLDIYGYPINGAEGYLSPTQIARYNSLIDSAYRAVGIARATKSHLHRAANSPIYDRIRYLELSLDFAMLELSMSHIIDDPNFIDRADRFVNDCKRFGIPELMEMGYSPDEYRADIDNYLQKCSRPSIAYGKPVTLRHPASEQYPASGAQGLTDGVAGILNYNQNWVGFFGDTLDAVIDLGHRETINEVSIDFFFYPLSWIFLPQNVTVYASADNHNWIRLGQQSIPNPEILAKPAIHTFRITHSLSGIRYIRVVAPPLPQIPEWHRATGNPCWIFADEILVR